MLKATGLFKSFLRRHPVLNGLHLTLHPGTICGLRGENGSGKSTLLDALSGNLAIERGEISLNGTRIDSLKRYQISRAGISRTFQNARSVWGLTVRQNIDLALPCQALDSPCSAMLPQRFTNKSRLSIDGAVSQTVERFGLEPIADRLAGDLSFGQQKRLSIACCVAQNQQILLLDEPFAGLSESAIPIVVQILTEERDRGKAILVVDHDHSLLRTIANEILRLEGGRLHPSHTDRPSDATSMPPSHAIATQ